MPLYLLLPNSRAQGSGGKRSEQGNGCSQEPGQDCSEGNLTKYQAAVTVRGVRRGVWLGLGQSSKSPRVARVLSGRGAAPILLPPLSP